jgi:alkanesulfonate monooxygenase SsuD/methylene tetrahydromethanopterin reductase-like flavin-dependent oxidoreductase (luciferase family)
VSALRLDLLLDPFGATWPELRDTATFAADSGFAGIWTYDHLDGRVFGADHVLECWTVLTALATTVPEVGIGPMVLNVANRHPSVLAVMAATLQDVSGGRLLLGLGAGAQPGTSYASEQQAIGKPVIGDATRRTEVEECATELRRVWRSPGFLQPDPEPPIVIAALGPKMAEVAGRRGDGINLKAADPRLPELLTVALDARDQAGRQHERFLVTVFSQLDERWGSAETASPAGEELAALGVHRLALAVRSPFDRPSIAAVARLLCG